MCQDVTTSAGVVQGFLFGPKRDESRPRSVEILRASSSDALRMTTWSYWSAQLECAVAESSVRCGEEIRLRTQEGGASPNCLPFPFSFRLWISCCRLRKSAC